MTDDAKLAALLSSRICHDLISPIGAIGNGVELVNMTARAPSPEMALIEESVTNANVRIRFFRIAFGVASPGQMVARREAAEILDGLSKGGRLGYTWQSAEDHERADVQLAFLLIQCMESSMPYGGMISVACEGGAWIITGSAQKLKADNELWAILTRDGSQGDLVPATVHFGLAAIALAARGRKLTVNFAETAIQASF